MGDGQASDPVALRPEPFEWLEEAYAAGKAHLESGDEEAYLRAVQEMVPAVLRAATGDVVDVLCALVALRYRMHWLDTDSEQITRANTEWSRDSHMDSYQNEAHAWTLLREHREALIDFATTISQAAQVRALTKLETAALHMSRVSADFEELNERLLALSPDWREIITFMRANININFLSNQPFRTFNARFAAATVYARGGDFAGAAEEMQKCMTRAENDDIGHALCGIMARLIAGEWLRLRASQVRRGKDLLRRGDNLAITAARLTVENWFGFADMREQLRVTGAPTPTLSQALQLVEGVRHAYAQLACAYPTMTALSEAIKTPTRARPVEFANALG